MDEQLSVSGNPLFPGRNRNFDLGRLLGLLLLVREEEQPADDGV